jgi:type II secretory pathway pseudopilin PulG
LQEQKVELEIQREAIIKSTAEEIEALRAKAHRRKMNTYRVLAVAATVAAILIGIALYKVRQVQKLQASQDLAIAYIEKGEQAQRVIQQAHQEKAQAESISEHLKQRLQTLSEIYHLNLNSLDALEQDSSGANDEISAIEAEHKEKMAKDVEKRILVGVPLTVSDKGLTTLILGTELVQLRQIPSKENDASQETSVPRKIVFWRKDTPLWQAQYVAYILMRAGVKVKMIRECGSGPKENANASLPDEARDFNLCRWDDKNWAGLSVVVGWSSALPLKDNCALTVAQAKDKKSWAMCLDQSKNPGASVSPEELNP